MSAPLSGAREARPWWLGRLVARAAAREIAAFVVPGPEIARARGLDLGAAGVRPSPTPRHASVLVVVGGLPEGLRNAAAVAYAQMPRPRAVLAVDTEDVSPLPGPDVTADAGQDALASGVARLRRLFEEGAFDPGAESFEAVALRGRIEYTCSMHPEVVQDEPGTCPECGMDLVPRQAGDGEEDAAGGHQGHAHDEGSDANDEEDHGGHGHAHHGAEDRHDEPERDAGDDHDGESGESGGHEGMDHGGMDFMSMVEMTRGTPRSSDGLQMEWVEAPFGPLFPGLPGGLDLTFTLDGDTVAAAKVGSAVGGRAEHLNGPVGVFVERLARLDPLSPVAYRLLALRAIEDAAGVASDERTARARAGALERERAASHLGWLSGFGYLIGYRWLSRRAAELQFATLRADAGGMADLQDGARKFAWRVARTPLLRRRLAGIGVLPEGAQGSGPVARAGGVGADERADDEAYRALGFEPVVREGGDALARLGVRLAEIEKSLEVAVAAGSLEVPALATGDGVSGTGTATVETPRGAATLRARLESGEVVDAELDTPSTRHLGLVEGVVEQREVADALVGVASLDLSPWEVVR